MNARSRLRRLVVATLAGAALVLGAPAAPTAAADGTPVTTHSRYVVDPDAGVVRGSMAVTVTRPLAGADPAGMGTNDALRTLTVPIPAEATEVQARVAGTPMTVSTAAAAANGPAAEASTTQATTIGLPTPLQPGDSVTVDVTFDLVAAPPRSTGSTRVAAKAATFAVFTGGNEGQTSVEVVVPEGWSATATSDVFREETVDGGQVLQATTNTDPTGIVAVISLHDAEGAATLVTVGGAAFALREWPGDTAWVTAMSEALTLGLPTLQDTLGAVWPGAGTTTIREVATISAIGVDGWYDPQGRQLFVGESLDPAVIYHQLAHVWISSETYTDPWLREGIAEYAARRTVHQVGVAAAPPVTVSRDALDAIPLNSWEGASASGGTATDAYAYPAARQVVEELLSGLDPDTVTDVLWAANRGESAYAPPWTPLPSPPEGTDWRRFLDLVEIRGGQVQAPYVYAQWVLSSDERPLLTARAAARSRYAELDATDGTWLPPRAVRTAMTAWSFEEAETAMSAAGPAAAATAEVERAATRAGVVVPTGVQALYENAASVEAISASAAELTRSATALRDLGTAIAASRSANPAARVGAKVLFIRSGISEAASHLDRGEIREGQDESAAVAARARWATPTGALILGLLALLLVGALRVGWQVMQHHRPDRHPDSAVEPQAAATLTPDGHIETSPVLRMIPGPSAPL